MRENGEGKEGCLSGDDPIRKLGCWTGFMNEAGLAQNKYDAYLRMRLRGRGRLENSSSSIFINAIITKCLNFNAKVRQLDNPNQNGSVRCARERHSNMTEAVMRGWERPQECQLQSK